MYQEIITFWFEEIDQSQWWVKDDDFDCLIKKKFSAIHHQAINCEFFLWRETPLGALAEVIILDQFSRNMYRDTVKAFTYDALALALAQSAISRGVDTQLPLEMRSFLYMPFMHSESLIIHTEAVSLFSALGIQSSLDFENKHKAIIERFGRYPHRNEILGRDSTPEETTFLNSPGSRF